MLNKEGLKTVGSFVVEVVCPLVFTGIVLHGSSKCKRIVVYNDAVGVIMNSSMLASDKYKAVSELKFGESSDFYKAIGEVANSSMFSSDKLNVILKMCEKAES